MGMDNNKKKKKRLEKYLVVPTMMVMVKQYVFKYG